MLAGALLVLIARGFLYRRRSPRLLVSRGADLRALGGGPRVWLAALLTAMRVLAVALLALALMGPQSIHARNATEVEGIDIVLTLDLSLSMQAADIKPNRFDATKQVVDHFIERRPNDRIGAVIFGRDAYTLLPITTDHQALRTMIGELDLNLIDGRGTAIGNGIGVALNRLRKSTAKSKVVILATDGDSNSGNVSPQQAAEYAHALGVKVYTILMGKSEKAPVQTGRDLFGRPVFDRGNFPINPELLKKVASADRRRSLPGLGSRGPRAQLPHHPRQARALADRGRGPRLRRAVSGVRQPGARAGRARARAGAFVLRRWP